MDLPDLLLDLPVGHEDRRVLRGDLAQHAGRHFVRALLEIPVEKYGQWRVGTWVEVEQAEYEHAFEVWGTEGYGGLRLSGTLANDLGPRLDLTVPLGSEVSVFVPDSESLPRIERQQEGELAHLLREPWAQSEFERYAVDRGYL